MGRIVAISTPLNLDYSKVQCHSVKLGWHSDAVTSLSLKVLKGASDVKVGNSVLDEPLTCSACRKILHSNLSISAQRVSHGGRCERL